jgi:REP element-mobilizing transposase RayT
VTGGFYHVTLRGNHRLPIFESASDRDMLNAIVCDVVGEHGARVHAFCWMTNHIHLLLQVSDTPLGKIVLRIASRYARGFQARLSTTGHLFERRYHAVLVDAEQYLLTLIRYIHLNPVRAGLVTDPGSYVWSSHRDYVGTCRTPWVYTAFALGMLSSIPSQSVLAYLAWLNASDGIRWGEGILVPNATDHQVLGSDAFVARVRAVIAPKQVLPSMDELLDECSRRFGISGAAIKSCSKSRDLSLARAWLSHEALSRGVAGTSAIARYLGRDESAVRRLVLRRPQCAMGEMSEMSDPAP